MTEVVLRAGDIATNKTANTALEALSGGWRGRSGSHPSPSLMFLPATNFPSLWDFCLSLLVSESMRLVFLHCSFHLHPSLFLLPALLSPLACKKSVCFLYFKHTWIDGLGYPQLYMAM